MQDLQTLELEQSSHGGVQILQVPEIRWYPSTQVLQIVEELQSSQGDKHAVH